MLMQSVIGFYTARALRNVSNIIHINYTGLPFFTLPLLVGFKLSGFRVILNVHDVLPHRWLLPRPLRFIERMTIRGQFLAPDKLIVHHLGARNSLHEEFSISPDKVAVVPHGPFRLSDVPIPYKEKGTEIVALLFGHLRENKGIHLAIRAVQKLRAEGHPIKLFIAGHAYTSERSYWERCMALIKASPTGISVMDEYIQEEEIKDLIKGAHFFLLPYTEYHSQSGVAALALSNGRAIVAPHLGGLSEVLMPGRTGILIEQPTTVESVEQALLQTIRLGHHELRKLGKQAFELYNAKFSWDEIAQEYAKLYLKMETQGGRKG
jgi:glycosyltransferase involved in cell wall biosynthesis